MEVESAPALKDLPGTSAEINIDYSVKVGGLLGVSTFLKTVQNIHAYFT